MPKLAVINKTKPPKKRSDSLSQTESKLPLLADSAPFVG